MESLHFVCAQSNCQYVFTGCPSTCPPLLTQLAAVASFRVPRMSTCSFSRILAVWKHPAQLSSRAIKDFHLHQKANRQLRESTSHRMIDGMFKELMKKSKHMFNIRNLIKEALFPFSMYQVLGRDPDFVFVKEFERNVSRWEIFDALVMDPLKSAIEVDWREFSSLEKPDCYLDILLTKATHLSEKELLMSVWEPIIESADTTLVTIEWAMYEIAKNSAVQERLHQEICGVAASRIVTEDDLPKLKYLDAVVKETLRRYPPVPLLPPRHVDEDVKLGGYDVKKGWQIIINIYGINYCKDTWNKPEVWDPERILRDEGLDMGYKDHRILSCGTGKRMCAGVAQAMFVIPMVIAVLVQHFQWILPTEDKTKTSEDTVFVTTHKLHPLETIATPRCSSRLPSLSIA